MICRTRSAARALTVLALLAAPAAPVATRADGAPTVSPDTVVLDGRGHGHGVGLQQDGALTMGRQGMTVDAILGAFYPGTRYGRAGGPVRVAVDTQPAAGTGVVTAGSAAVLRTDGVETPVPAGTVLSFRRTGSTWSVLLHDPAPGAPASAKASTRPRAAAAAFASTGPLDPSPTPSDSSGPPPSASASPGPSGSPSPSPSASRGVGVPSVVPSSGGASGSPSASGSGGVPPTSAGTAGSAGSGPSASSSPTGGLASTGTAAVPDRTVTSSGSPVLDPGSGTASVRGRTYAGTLTLVCDDTSLRVVDTVDVETYLRGLGEVRDPAWPQASLRAQVVAARSYALHAVGGPGPFDLWDDDRSQVYLGTNGYAAQDQAVAATKGVVLTAGGVVADTVFSASGGGVTATPEEGFGSPGPEYLRAATYPTSDPHPWTTTTTLGAVATALQYPGTLTGMSVASRGPSGRATTVHLDGSAGGQDRTGIEVQQALDLRSTLFEVKVGDQAPSAAQALPTAPPDLPSVLDSAGLDGPTLDDTVAVPVPAARVAEDMPGAPVWLAVLLALAAAGAVTVRTTGLGLGGRPRLLRVYRFIAVRVL